jgi:N utilization substance protein A
VKLDTEHLEYLNYFEDLTGAEVKDCFTYHDKITFLIAEGQLGLALGNNADNIDQAETRLGQDIKVVEYTDDKAQFLYNFLQPLDITSVDDDNGILRITPEDDRAKGIIIGRGGNHIERIKEIMSRHFDYKRITVE